MTGGQTALLRVVLASDHAGFQLKRSLLSRLDDKGYELLDIGTDNEDPVDYPQFAKAAALAVAKGEGERAIIICGSGVGASIVANKIPGIRAGLCHDIYSAHQGVEHDDMNVLCLGSRVIGSELARELTMAFLGARFTGEERHRRRLDELRRIEQEYGR